MKTEFIRSLVIGSGTMGTGIAISLARAGIEVNLVDLKQELVDNGLNRISKFLEGSVKKGKMTEEEINFVKKRIKPLTNLKDATKDIQIVIEAIIEEEGSKKELFKELDVLCDDHVIFATNTSALGISNLASVTNRTDRFLGMHFFNPPQIMKLVEIVKGQNTANPIIEDIVALCEKLGKIPILSSETPGFIVNRLLWVFLNESYKLLETGVAKKKDIDKAIKLGLNHPMGPLELSDYIGLDILLNIGDYISEQLGSQYAPAPLLRKLVEEDKLGKKTGKGFYEY